MIQGRTCVCASMNNSNRTGRKDGNFVRCTEEMRCQFLGARRCFQSRTNVSAIQLCRNLGCEPRTSRSSRCVCFGDWQILAGNRGAGRSEQSQTPHYISDQAEDRNVAIAQEQKRDWNVYTNLWLLFVLTALWKHAYAGSSKAHPTELTPSASYSRGNNGNRWTEPDGGWSWREFFSMAQSSGEPSVKAARRGWTVDRSRLQVSWIAVGLWTRWKWMDWLTDQWGAFFFLIYWWLWIFFITGGFRPGCKYRPALCPLANERLCRLYNRIMDRHIHHPCPHNLQTYQCTQKSWLNQGILSSKRTRSNYTGDRNIF